MRKDPAGRDMASTHSNSFICQVVTNLLHTELTEVLCELACVCEHTHTHQIQSAGPPGMWLLFSELRDAPSSIRLMLTLILAPTHGPLRRPGAVLYCTMCPLPRLLTLDGAAESLNPSSPLTLNNSADRQQAAPFLAVKILERKEAYRPSRLLGWNGRQLN